MKVIKSFLKFSLLFASDPPSCQLLEQDCRFFGYKRRFELRRKYNCLARYSGGTSFAYYLNGGVYKERERIHRNIADLRLLPIPRS